MPKRANGSAMMQFSVWRLIVDVVVGVVGCVFNSILHSFTVTHYFNDEPLQDHSKVSDRAMTISKGWLHIYSL